MLFVVTSGLLVVKNGTLGDASMLGVQFPRFGSYRRQRDALLVCKSEDSVKQNLSNYMGTSRSWALFSCFP